MFEIVEARRESAPITAALIGGSGSGKTYSALKFARGLVGNDGKIVVIDTEGGRSKIYADDPVIKGFHHLDLVEPYTSERFRQAFKEAVKFGADAVVIDTISHEHEGFLEFADQEAERMNNSKMSNRNKWIKPKAGRKRFYSAISSSHVHVIATIRLNRIVNMDVKPAVEIMKPECDKDFPYRLDLSVEINPDHTTKVIKVPEPLIGIVTDGVMLDVEHGRKLSENIDKQPKPDNAELKELIQNLEDVADNGTEIFKTAWGAAWKRAGPEGDLKKQTPKRIEMLKHIDRLKALALAADQSEKTDHSEGELGEFSQPNHSDDDQERGMFEPE